MLFQKLPSVGTPFLLECRQLAAEKGAINLSQEVSLIFRRMRDFISPRVTSVVNG